MFSPWQEYTIAAMKPRDLNGKNWDVNVAVFDEVPDFDARVTADGKHMWFRVYARHCFADISIPINDFKKASDFIETFDLATLTDARPEAGLRLGSYSVEIFSRVGKFKNGKIVYRKTPFEVLIAPLGRHKSRSSVYKRHNIAIRLSLFKKLIRWYNSDI